MPHDIPKLGEDINNKQEHVMYTYEAIPNLMYDVRGASDFQSIVNIG